jgi:hypothetical protein
MCDCCWIQCEEEGCQVIAPVHIEDFCVPRAHVHVRCWRHKPVEPGWSVFKRCELGERASPLEDAWLQHDLRRRRSAYFRVDGMEFPLDKGYGICPNGDSDDEALYVPKGRKTR